MKTEDKVDRQARRIGNRWRWPRIRHIGLIGAALAGLPSGSLRAQDFAVRRVVIDLSNTGRHLDFRPDEVMGAGIDGAHEGEIDKLLTPHNLAAMKSAGLRPLTYRLRTELGIEVWHWNPEGTWSDLAHQQGYWTSSDTSAAPIQMSWGYRLPRRGDTIDEANDDDYSRLTDGDRATFWKSNPYLDPSVLKDGFDHPQWLRVRFDKARQIDSAVIDWADPYAVNYEIQYWSGKDDYDSRGSWITFPNGRITQGHGGRVSVRLAGQPITTSHVRVLLHLASGTAPAGANDWRDRLGYAVREVAFGVTRSDGYFEDAIIHAPDHDRQTVAHVSSTDPWHRASDRDPNLEQTGIDRIFASGLGFGRPVMMPTGLLYDTPDNIAAELRYLARRHYPVTQIELGEEPDGQYGPPADYGALYLAAVDRLKGIIPSARFGGPSLQSAFTITELTPETRGSWAGWFIKYLKQRKRLNDLSFFSFEYYPFDNICGDINAKLIQQSGMLDEVVRRLDDDGVPRTIPRIISEYGFSAFSGRAMSEMPSALLMSGIVGQWLHSGGSAAYMFGYGPAAPANQNLACAGYGNMALHLADPAGQAGAPMPSYYAARLLTQVWTMPGHGLHRLLDTRIDNMPGREVDAYAVRRPDGRIALLAINRSPDKGFKLQLVVKNRAGTQLPFGGKADTYLFGSEQYAWLDDGPQSRPLRSNPPKLTSMASKDVDVTLPPNSVVVTVLTGPALINNKLR